uniref:Uncharacterized protein n=1 Tax=Caulobacter sp. (strain K31) TaxID=366602 RepID=B0T6I4_CAUSK
MIEPRPVHQSHEPVRADASGISVSDYPSVQARLASLGCGFPQGVAILPANFAVATDRSQFKELAEAPTIRKLLRSAGLPVSGLLPDGKTSPLILNRSAGWAGPALFISAGLLSANATAVSVALGILTNYLSDFLKGSLREKGVELDIIVERRGDRVCKKISYQGPIEGLEALARAVARIADE